MVIGADAAVPPHPLLDSTTGFIEQVRQDATRLDVDGVTRQDVVALKASGLLGVWAREELGGGGAPDAVVRELTEQLAGASGALWFVATQHRSPTEAARLTDNDQLRDRWAATLASGRALGAVAFAHVRRPGPPQVLAERDGDGWRVSGRLDWVTSWGLADVLLLLAETPGGDVVQLLIPAEERPGLTVTGPLALAVMAGTSTVGMRLEGVAAEADEVAAVVPKPRWLERDAQRAANASPASFGLARAAIDRLADSAARRGSTEAVELAGMLAERLVAVRREAYGLVDDAAPEAELVRRVELRAEALDLCVTATTALVVAEGGRAMVLVSPAQRWAREALFLLVQAQTGPLREQLLGRLRAGLLRP